MPVRWCRRMLIAAAMAVFAQTTPDPDAVLERARPLILNAIRRLPKYTCTQTVNRYYYRSQTPRAARMSCDDLVALKHRGANAIVLAATDRLRLDVAIADRGREIYSWAGAGNLSSDRLDQIVGGGPIGTGPFGSFLVDIFGQGGIHFLFHGPRALDGRTALEYHFEVPLERSSYRLIYGDRQQFFPFDGVLQLAPDSADLLRLSVRTGALPRDAGVCEAITTVDFAHIRIGKGDYLLPARSDLRFLHTNGDETENVTSFSSCHEYETQSTIQFGSVDPAAPQAPATAAQVRAGVPVTIRLTAPIDTSTASAGDPVTATVAYDGLDAVYARTHRLAIPPGAIVHGRIIRLEHCLEAPRYFLIAFAFTSIESGGVIRPFAARLRHPIEFPNGGKLRLGEYFVHAHTAFARGGTLVFQAPDDHYVIPRDFRWGWITSSIRD